MRWLVSMKWKPNFWHPGPRITSTGPVEGVVLLDEHPAKYVADCKRRLLALHEAETEPEQGEYRADEILAVYSATQVPDDVLSQEEIDILE